MNEPLVPYQLIGHLQILTLAKRTLKVLTRLLQNKNYHVIRYNSRGVGKSSGWPSLTGKAEGDDLKAVVQEFLVGKPEIDNLTIIVSATEYCNLMHGPSDSSMQGYSHGSLIASLHPVLNPHVKTSYILLSYPLSPRGLLTMFHTDTYASALRDLLCDPEAKLLLIYGDKDEFTSSSKYDDWVGVCRQTDGLRAKLDVVRVVGANHFWQTHDARTALEQAVGSWLS